MIPAMLTAAFLQVGTIDDAETEAVVRAIYESLERQKPGERRLRVMMFTAEWCYVCKQGLRDFRPWLEKSGWSFGDATAHVELVDADKRPDLVRQYRVTSLPTFVLVENGKEVRRTGYAGRSTIPNLWSGK